MLKQGKNVMKLLTFCVYVYVCVRQRESMIEIALSKKNTKAKGILRLEGAHIENSPSD